LRGSACILRDTVNTNPLRQQNNDAKKELKGKEPTKKAYPSCEECFFYFFLFIFFLGGGGVWGGGGGCGWGGGGGGGGVGGGGVWGGGGSNSNISMNTNDSLSNDISRKKCENN